MNYETLTIQVTLRSPLLLGVDREFAIFAETRDYIPGSVLRGSLARLLAEAGASAELETLFGAATPPLIFENLHPTPGTGFAHPLPLSARTCKYQGGFRSDDKYQAHGIGDILISQAMFERALLNPASGPLPFLYQPRCPECGEEVTQPALRFYETVGLEYHRARVPVRRQARTAINRSRYTAADQLLYVLETVEPGQSDGKPLLFQGQVRYQAPEQKNILEQRLSQIKWLGRGRSRGLGQVSLTLVEAKPAEPPLRERLDRFNEAAQKERVVYEYLAGSQLFPADTFFIGLDLLAPTVFTRCGLPGAEPDLADLNLGPQVALYRGFVDTLIVGGWHLKAGRPRRKVLATQAGSTYLIGAPGWLLNDLEQILAPLEITGLGAERERGLGRVLISSPFHYQPEVIL